MPRYFFDLASPGAVERDELGIEFDDLDMAYLDAWRAVAEISAEMSGEGRDPSRLRFDVRDACRRPLLDIPFGEMTKPCRLRPPPPSAAVLAAVAIQRARSDELKAQLRVVVAEAEATLDVSRETVRQSRLRAAA